MPSHDSFQVLGVRVDAVQIPSVLQQMQEWASAWRSGCERRCHYIAVTNIHGITEAQRDEEFKLVLNTSELCVPDGTPLVWIGRQRGFALSRRVYGPELMIEVCRRDGTRDLTHFFYGGAPGVADELAIALARCFPGLRVVGTYSPPFRPLTPAEDQQVVDTINRTAPDVVWVGLGCPKQERWMYEHRTRLAVPILIGVGQAFDIHSGKLRQAPSWMRDHGLEWLFRLCLEPRRLWRRYLVNIVRFLYYLSLESLGLKRFAASMPHAPTGSPRSRV
ncbi:MAG: WecB/TagA/CpsF family glycosyltransferase [Acidobacteriia bacterium]|nr:WecB/TagA/CpsF family glycosyltransferase [Terriglobia bacterium]